MKIFRLMSVVLILLTILFSHNANAQMRDMYEAEAEALRQAIQDTDDSVLKREYRSQLRQVENNIRALESDAPVFRFEDAATEFQRKLNEGQQQLLQQQRELNAIVQEKQRQATSPYRCCRKAD
ncbi:MAG: hypothetical protein U0412_04800 [Nitrospira sp.]